MRARARTALVGVAMAALSALQGCTESMLVEGIFGIDKYNVNQCLLQPSRRTRGSHCRGVRAGRSRKMEDGRYSSWIPRTGAPRSCTTSPASDG